MLVFFFKQKTAYEIEYGLVGSEMCIRDRAGVRSANEKISGMNTMIRKFPKSPLAIDANMEIANTYMGNEKFRESIPYLKAVAENTENSSLVPPVSYTHLTLPTSDLV